MKIILFVTLAFISLLSFFMHFATPAGPILFAGWLGGWFCTEVVNYFADRKVRTIVSNNVPMMKYSEAA
jgi:hypothetical protein